MDGDGIGYACDPGERMMDDELDGEWRQGRARFDKRPVRIPVAPCFRECPDRFDQGMRMELEVVLDFAAELRIVDDRGHVVARRATGDKKPLRFEVAGDHRYVAPGAGPGDAPFEGRGYFLEVVPREPIEEGMRPIRLRQTLVPPEM